MNIPADEIYDLIRHHSGYGHRHIPDDVLRSFIQFEVDSGRWAGTRNTDTGEVTGWISWYNLDADSLALVREYGLPGCYQNRISLNTGAHCYISNVVVKEGQPKETFRLLWNLACQQNREAKTMNAHLCNRPGGKLHWRWFTKPNVHRSQFQEAAV